MPALRLLLPVYTLRYSSFPVIKETPSITISTTTLTATTTTTFTTSLIPSNMEHPQNDIAYVQPEPTEASHKPLLNLHIPGLDPSSPYFTSSATNQTMLTNAIFSHPAIITWVSLFFAFLVFAGVVFGLQKIMRRVRARRWIRDQLKDKPVETTAKEDDSKGCCTGETANGKEDRKNNVRFGHSRPYGGCEFINGSDISLRADEGVDERNGSWSKRRDKRFRNPSGGRKRRIGAA